MGLTRLPPLSLTRLKALHQVVGVEILNLSKRFGKMSKRWLCLADELTTDPSGDASPSQADMRLTRRLAEGARILQINMLDNIFVGQPFDDRPGYFGFKEAGMI